MTTAEDQESTSLFTFFVTDIEDSTALWEADAAAMQRQLARHDELLYRAVENHGGTVFKGTGDGILAVFDSPANAVRAAADAQHAIESETWLPGQRIRVRMGLDTGPAQERSGDYFGPPLNRVMRVMSSGHGGQVLLTSETLADSGAAARELGHYDYKGIGRISVHQLSLDGLEGEFPELRTDRTPPAVTRAGFAKTVHGYELRQMLGEGDFGIVYQAHQPGIGREVAIKVIRPEYANQPSFIKRFEIEAKFVAQLEHPYIVPLYDFWRDPDGAYIVMRMLKGGSLRQSLDRSAWNAQAALRLIDQVGAALSYAHRNGVIHRDLKPANVLLDEDGNGYLSDFGIATRLLDEAGVPVSSSRAYISPEELAGSRLTIKSDIYNLGVLIFEMLTGKRPHFGATLPTVTHERPDLPTDLDAVIATSTAADPDDRYERVEALLDALREALGDGDVAASTEPVQLHAVRNPYKGLRAFQETDRTDFFGRDELIAEIIEVARTQPLVAVVGPSGSGKSSVVKAGLLPAVRAGAITSSRDWLVADMFPGSYPFEELGAALMRVAVDRPSNLFDDLATDDRGLVRATKRVLPDDGSGLVLLIDQFEELFSLATQPERERFLANLVTLASDARSRVKVVITLRADYFGYPLDYPEFAPLVRNGLVAVAMPSEAELTEAVLGPAEAVGLELEPGLVNEIVHDVAEQPGGLPLMQYALTELYRLREGRTLTLRAYEDSGGVLGALGRRAETIFQGLDGQAKATARQLFLRLVSVDEHSDDTRRRVRRSDLDSLGLDSDSLNHVIEEYGTYRLLTFDVDPVTRGPTIEVAHEALIREWSRLDSWIGEHREDLVLERRLDDALREWETGDRDASYLLRGSRLEQFEGWAAGSAVRLTSQQQEFLDTSVAARHEEEQREAERQAHERALELRSQRRLRFLVAVMGVAAVIAGVLGAFAVRQAGEAETQREAAIEQRDTADQLRMTAEEQQAILDQQVIQLEAAALAETAMEMTDEDAVLAARLAQEAIAVAVETGIDPTRAVEAFHVALQRSRLQFPPALEQETTVLAPDGLRGVFIVPLAVVFDMAESAQIGQLTAPECEQWLGRACSGDPQARIGPELLASSVLEPSLAFPVLEGTGLTYTSNAAVRRLPTGGAADDRLGVFVELAEISDQTGVDVLDINLSLRLDTEALADYIVMSSSEAAGQARAANLGLLRTIPSSRPEQPEIPVEPFDIEQWLVAPLSDKEPPAITDAFRSDQGLVALWFDWSPWVVNYRSDIFEREELNAPDTWDQLLTLSDTLIERGYTPWCFSAGAGGGAESAWAFAAAIMLTFEGPEFYDDWLSHRVAADDPRAVAAFTRMHDLLFSEGRIQDSREDTLRASWLRATGDMNSPEPSCVMWGASVIDARTITAPISQFPLPGPQNGLMVDGLAMVFNVDRPETRQLARSLTSPSFGRAYAATGINVAANQRIRGGVFDTYPTQTGDLADMVHEALEIEALRPWPLATPTLPWELVGALNEATLQWLSAGPAVLESVLAGVESAWQSFEAETGG